MPVVKVVDGYAYVSSRGDRTTYLTVLSLADPARPVLVASLPVAAWVYRIHLSGNLLYLAGVDQGLIIIDVADPLQPRQIAQLPTSNPAACAGLRYEGGLEVIDVRDLAAPFVVASVDSAEIVGGLHADEASVYTIGSGGFKVIDVSEPSAPFVLGIGSCLEFTGAVFSFVQVSGRYAYIADGDAGLLVIDVGSPADSRQVATMPARNSCAVQVVGQYAYLGRQYVWDDDAQAYRSRLQIIDVADPLHPVTVGIYNTEIGMSRLNDLHVDGTRACPGFHVEQPEGPAVGEIRVLDVGNTANPVVIASCRTKAPVSMVQAVGNRVYAAEDRWGMPIYELTLSGSLKLNPPVLSGNTLTLSWNDGAGVKLQKTLSLTNPNWQDVAGSEGLSSIALPREGAAIFFRLIQP